METVAFVFIMIFAGESYVMDEHLTADDCAASIVEYANQFHADAFICEMEF